MTKDLFYPYYDLVTPDGKIKSLVQVDENNLEIVVEFENIPSSFIGYLISKEEVLFNVKSTLAQLGINATLIENNLQPKFNKAESKVRIFGINALGKELIKLFGVGMYVGKLFAADARRRVRDPDYLTRMFGRADQHGDPLLTLGGMEGSSDLILEKIEGRTVAFIRLKKGKIEYDDHIHGFLPTLVKAMHKSEFPVRDLIALHQVWKELPNITVEKDSLMLVKTLPLHVRTVFGRVVDSFLPQGVHHTSASILQPDTQASGDIYELFGESQKEITDIPLEFYTLEPYREHVFFSDRDQLLSCLDNPEAMFNAFKTSPAPKHHKCAVFVAKGEQLVNLTEKDWISEDTYKTEFPGFLHGERQAHLAENYIKQQPGYPFLEAIQEESITSQGILLMRYFPSPLMKRMFLGERIQRCLKRIYFSQPSHTHGDFFSHEDRSFLHDLGKFGIPVFWVDESCGHILQYVPRHDKDSGMFVPIQYVEHFLRSTMIGIYGSNLLDMDFEEELKKLLEGLLAMREEMNHPLLSANAPLSLVTGGGPGVMKLGNKVAREVGILSCANIVDFRSKSGSVVNEQFQNPYVDAKMTYRLDKLVERQAEFNLDLPIFLPGGIGTDFEFSLEMVRRKTGVGNITPVLLFGTPEYWEQKISSKFKLNRSEGTITGSEWISNCFYCINSAEQGLKIYKDFFRDRLPIGKEGPISDKGFVIS